MLNKCSFSVAMNIIKREKVEGLEYEQCHIALTMKITSYWQSEQQ